MKLLGSILIGSLLVLGCNKPAPQVVSVGPQTPTTQLETQGSVKMTNPTDNPIVIPPTKTSVQPVVKPTKAQTLVKKHSTKQSKTSKSSVKKLTNVSKADKEQAAYLVAFVNKVKYVCYRKVVDQKIANDVRDGYRDLGNFLDYVHKTSDGDIINSCIQGGFVHESDVKEFKGHLPKVARK